MTLRYYQHQAIDAIFAYWQEEDGNPLVDMATGTGKSITMATLTVELVQGWPDLRVMNIAHREELVEGNFSELINIWPFAPTGIYAAALGRRDAHAQILFSQIQTVYNKAAEIGHVDVLEIDEVHLVPSNEATMYGTLIRELLAINPDMKIVGFTATPYRMDDGRLDEGENRMFDKVVYTYGIAQGVEDGYLAPLSSKGMETGFDLTGVGTLGGDYKKGALAAAVDKEEVTRQAVAEAIAYANRLNKKTALFFCSGVDHAHHVRDEVRSHGLSCETIHGNTPKGERRRILADYKAGRLWGVSNDAVLTVGTNIPNIDMIADLAPTKSTSRYVQKAGRGTRPIYIAGFVDREDTTAEERRAAIAAGPKPSCLYLDYAKNVSYHGPVDRAQPKTPGKGSGEPPVKICPECEELVHISVMKCPACDYDFPPSEDVKITQRAATTPIMSVEKDMWRAVTSRRFAQHPGKEGKPDSVKATFMCGFLAVNNWLCPGHTGFAKSKADRWWVEHGGQRPFPNSVEDWLLRQHELNDTAEIEIEYNGKYPNARNYRAASTGAVARPAIPDNAFRIISAANADGGYGIDLEIENIKTGNKGKTRISAYNTAGSPTLGFSVFLGAVGAPELRMIGSSPQILVGKTFCCSPGRERGTGFQFFSDRHLEGASEYAVGVANDNHRQPDNDNVPAGHTADSWKELLDDEIPF